MNKNVISAWERGEISEEEMMRVMALSRSERKSSGAVYTPRDIAESMTAQSGLRAGDRVWEPSCGHGAFVLRVLDHAEDSLGMSVADCKSWMTQRFLCTDLSADVVSDLREILSARFRMRGEASSASDFINVVSRDALSVRDRFDVVIGNPPYVRTKAMDPQVLASLRAEMPCMRSGNVDLYYAFVSRCVENSERTASLLIPTSCLSASGARTLRQQTFPVLKRVEDYGSGASVFSDAKAYVGAFFFDKRHHGDVVHAVSGSEIIGPWERVFSHDSSRIRGPAKPGIATLCDKAFMTDLRDGAHFGSITGVRIEPEMVRTLIKATKSSVRRHVVFPYDAFSGTGVISESRLRSDFPGAHEHLTRVRDLLEARDKGKTKGYPAWYAYGRSQGLHDYARRTLTVVPAVLGGASVPFEISVGERSPLFVSGYVVDKSSDPSGRLLSSEFRDYVIRNGRQKPGATDYRDVSSGMVNAFLSAGEST